MAEKQVIDTVQLDMIVNTGKSVENTNNLANGIDRLTKTFVTHKDGVLQTENVYKKVGNQITQIITKYNKLGEVLSVVTKEGIIEKVKAPKKVPAPKIKVPAPKKVTEPKKVPEPKKVSKTEEFEKQIKIGAIIGKLYFIRNITKRLGQSLANIVQYGIDFTETLNLWQTSMRGNIGVARTFISEMNRAYGVAEATLMKYQAVFKNMLSALGSLNESTAYNLSESLTQMALDFASLYNTSIDEAMNKFQAVLSGQVRPIRSISGYDITENTIFQLYKQMGGEKTMRQLDQVEKRLLRIYAVFQQMSTTSALGDLEKTLTTNANQLRVMKELAIETATWFGNGISYLIQESGILIEINALLYAIKEIAKSFAYESGYKEDNFISGIFDDSTAASEAVSELQGKLAGFDKFQVLQSAGGDDKTDVESIVANALKEYQSLYKNVVNPAVARGEEILKSLGLKLEEITGASGEIIKIWSGAGLDEIKSKILGISGALMSLIATSITNRIIKAISAIDAATRSIKLFNAISSIALYSGIFLIIYALSDLIKNWDKMSAGARIAKIAILGVGVALTIFATLSKIATAKTTLFTTALKLQKAAAYGLAVAGIGLLITNLTLLIGAWDKMTDFERVISIFGAIGAAALTAAAAIAAFHGAWTMGTAVVAIVGGLTAITAAFVGFKASMRELENTEKYANGGIATKGSLFLAGESGPELVTKTSGGNSTIMNMEQLQYAITKGMIIAMSSFETEQTQNISINVGSQNWFNITRKVARENGYDLVKVK